MISTRKFIPVIIVFLLLATQAAPSANAQTENFNFFNWVKSVLGVQTNKAEKLDLRNKINKEIKPLTKPFIGSSPSGEIRKEAKQRLEEIKPKIINKLKPLTAAVVGTGKIVGITGATLTATENTSGKTYTVITGKFDKCTTKFVRKFGGKSDLSEYTGGDTINVVGFFTDDTKTTIQACVIRDISIQKRHAEFNGNILSITASGFTMSTVSEKKQDQTVTISDTTKIINRRAETITKSALIVGHKVNVKGLWNTANNTVTQVTLVRDLSLPSVSTSKGVPSPAKP